MVVAGRSSENSSASTISTGGFRSSASMESTVQMGALAASYLLYAPAAKSLVGPRTMMEEQATPGISTMSSCRSPPDSTSERKTTIACSTSHA